MAGGFSSSDDDLIAGINVTPLVDVVLVLLIIFMITAPAIYQSAIKVQLPKARSGEDAAEKSPMALTLSKEGELAWGKDKLSWEEFDRRLSAMGDKASAQTAIISADQATPHGTVIKLMDALRHAGITRFALNVDAAKR